MQCTVNCLLASCHGIMAGFGVPYPGCAARAVEAAEQCTLKGNTRLKALRRRRANRPAETRPRQHKTPRDAVASNACGHVMQHSTVHGIQGIVCAGAQVVTSVICTWLLRPNQEDMKARALTTCTRRCSEDHRHCQQAAVVVLCIACSKDHCDCRNLSATRQHSRTLTHAMLIVLDTGVARTLL